MKPDLGTLEMKRKCTIRIETLSGTFRVSTDMFGGLRISTDGTMKIAPIAANAVRVSWGPDSNGGKE